MELVESLQGKPASPPAWWCGLKYVSTHLLRGLRKVTTCVVVWIEILHPHTPCRQALRHHLRGGVD